MRAWDHSLALSILMCIIVGCKSRFSQKCVSNPEYCVTKCPRYKYNAIEKCTICVCKETTGLFELDIQLEPNTEEKLKSLLNGKSRGGSYTADKWTFSRTDGGLWEIPYTLAKNLVSSARNAISSAVEEVHFRTCLRFVPRTNEEKYIKIFKGQGCWSYVGVRRTGVNWISIAEDCENKGVVLHELMHAIGFWHEQARPDRDNHVKILWNNIQPGMEYNFQKFHPFYVESYGSPYDKSSVTHYSQWTFSATGNPTIANADGTPLEDFERTNLSDSDVEQINTMYECAPITTTTGATTTAETTTPYCENVWSNKKCKRIKANGKCNIPSKLAKCRKSCNDC